MFGEALWWSRTSMQAALGRFEAHDSGVE